MIKGIHHVAIVVSSQESVGFYERLGFDVTLRIDRGYDKVVLLSGYGINIEMFIDSKYKELNAQDKGYGVRHLALKVENVEDMANEFECGQIMTDWVGKKYCYTTDPDGLQIEFHE